MRLRLPSAPQEGADIPNRGVSAAPAGTGAWALPPPASLPVGLKPGPGKVWGGFHRSSLFSVLPTDWPSLPFGSCGRQWPLNMMNVFLGSNFKFPRKSPLTRLGLGLSLAQTMMGQGGGSVQHGHRELPHPGSRTGG